MEPGVFRVLSGISSISFWSVVSSLSCFWNGVFLVYSIVCMLDWGEISGLLVYPEMLEQVFV